MRFSVSIALLQILYGRRAIQFPTTPTFRSRTTIFSYIPSKKILGKNFETSCRATKIRQSSIPTQTMTPMGHGALFLGMHQIFVKIFLTQLLRLLGQFATLHRAGAGRAKKTNGRKLLLRAWTTTARTATVRHLISGI